jgi:prefoldin subunit 5
MDTTHQVEETLRKLHALRDALTREIDHLYKDIDQVENDNLGTMNKIKSLLAQYLTRHSGIDSMMGDAYSIKKHTEFKNAHDYIDYLKSTQTHLRDVITKIDQVLSNLDRAQRDLSTQLESIRIWSSKADDLLR